ESTVQRRRGSPRWAKGGVSCRAVLEEPLQRGSQHHRETNLVERRYVHHRRCARRVSIRRFWPFASSLGSVSARPLYERSGALFQCCRPLEARCVVGTGPGTDEALRG